MKDYCGKIDDAVILTATKPFILLDWPTKDSIKCFDTENDARMFVAREKLKDAFVTFARLYSFSNGKWNKL